VTGAANLSENHRKPVSEGGTVSKGGSSSGRRKSDRCPNQPIRFPAFQSEADRRAVILQALMRFHGMSAFAMEAFNSRHETPQGMTSVNRSKTRATWHEYPAMQPNNTEEICQPPKSSIGLFFVDPLSLE
jgi:hypothetical protein